MGDDSVEILSQEISDEEGLYRVRAGQRVYYLTIPTEVFDEDTMCRPYLLIPQLPSLSDIPWSTRSVSMCYPCREQSASDPASLRRSMKTEQLWPKSPVLSGISQGSPARRGRIVS